MLTKQQSKGDNKNGKENIGSIFFSYRYDKRCCTDDCERYLPHAHAAQKLISPTEMGELFKVMALGKGISAPLVGFTLGDRSASL